MNAMKIEEVAQRYGEYMGGAQNIRQKVRESRRAAKEDPESHLAKLWNECCFKPGRCIFVDPEKLEAWIRECR